MPRPIVHASIDDGSAPSHVDNTSSGPQPIIVLLTVAETAALLRISTIGVRRLQQARQLPFIKVGGSVRFDQRDLIAYLAKRRVGALDP